jgi:ATP/maltotriose-dependent transcriptional regulator MalT
LEILRPLREWQGVIVALSTLAYGLFSKGSFSEAGLRWKEALAIAEEARDPLATANLTAHLGMAEIWLGNYSEAEHHSHRALSLARQLGDRALEVFALLNLGNAKTFAGALQEGQAVYEEGLRVAREIGYRRFIPHLLYCLGWSTLGLGNHLEARGLCQEALTLARESGDVHAQCFALMNLGAALLALGDHAGAEAHLTESLLAAWKTRNTSLVVSSLAPLAELRIKQEQHEQALRLLNTVLRHPASGAWVKQYAVVLGAKLDAHLSPGEPLEPGDCEQLRAVLEELLGQSLAELPTPFDQIVPVRASSLEPDPLTERERQVLRLIATGLPNKAIAKRLGISEKTVSRHLENIFVKLDVSSRSAATAYAVRVGIT